jgi:hypothetical protein
MSEKGCLASTFSSYVMIQDFSAVLPKLLISSFPYALHEFSDSKIMSYKIGFCSNIYICLYRWGWMSLQNKIIIMTTFLLFLATLLMGEGRGMYRVLVGKPEGKRPLGRPRCRWEDNIKADF